MGQGYKSIMIHQPWVEPWIHSPVSANGFIHCDRFVAIAIIGNPFSGPEFAIDLAARPKLAKWMEMILNNDAVKATLAEPEALCGTYKRYADNTALSKAPKIRICSFVNETDWDMTVMSSQLQILLDLHVRSFEILCISGASKKPKTHWCSSKSLVQVAEAVRQGKTADSVWDILRLAKCLVPPRGRFVGKWWHGFVAWLCLKFLRTHRISFPYVSHHLMISLGNLQPSHWYPVHILLRDAGGWCAWWGCGRWGGSSCVKVWWINSFSQSYSSSGQVENRPYCWFWKLVS